MREPDFEQDGWCLEDGEVLQHESPETFWLPELTERQSLQPGDLVKLIFRISVDNEEQPVAVERMWVIVREQVGEHYLGILDNDPYAIKENDEFGSGIELPFLPRHVIDIDRADVSEASQPVPLPKRFWDHG
ncbi:MAG: hypothetical protein CFE37_13025 [Alphaproteobacteria bacterium PA4]|nr:MAG: hypothetical protein CFE37_13025 [Alphaproteobacteria bacterium PA4]